MSVMYLYGSIEVNRGRITSLNRLYMLERNFLSKWPLSFAGVAQLGQSVRLIIERSRAQVPPPALVSWIIKWVYVNACMRACMHEINNEIWYLPPRILRWVKITKLLNWRLNLKTRCLCYISNELSTGQPNSLLLVLAVRVAYPFWCYIKLMIFPILALAIL